MRGEMKTSSKLILFILLTLPVCLRAEFKGTPFTMEDRDRIVRTEQKLDALDSKFEARLNAQDAKIETRLNALDAKIDLKVDSLHSEINARFDQLFNFLWAIIGIFTTMMVSVFGFAFWDRKLSLAPLKRENLKTLNALRDFSEHQPKLREILKNAGLL